MSQSIQMVIDALETVAATLWSKDERVLGDALWAVAQELAKNLEQEPGQ